MIYFLVWLFFGLFTALLASSRNRSVVGWFFIGFIFGPFGLLFAFFMKNGKKIEYQSENNLNDNNNNIISNQDYFYEIRPKNGVKTIDEWSKIKKVLFSYAKSIRDNDYKIKQNDAEAIYVEFSKSMYIKMKQLKKEDDKGSLRLIFKISSIKCGKIDFDNDIEIIATNENEINTKGIETSSDVKNTEKLIKLSDMLEKSLITEEEFKKHKNSIS